MSTDSRKTRGQRTLGIMLAQSAGTFLLQIISSAFSLINRVILARSLGTAGFGRLTEVRAWAHVVDIFTNGGFGWLLVRTIPQYETRGEWGLFKGLLMVTDRIVFGLAVLGGALIAVAGPMAVAPQGGVNEPGTRAFWVAAAFFPVLSLNGLRRSALFGLRKILTARLIDVITIGPMLLLLITAAWLLTGEGVLSPASAITLEYLTHAMSLLLFSVFLRRHKPPFLDSVKPVYSTGAWIRSALPMLLLGTMYRLSNRIIIILTGTLLGPASAGILGVAAEWGGIVAYPLVAVNTAISPHAARLFATRDNLQLQMMVTRSLRASFGSAIVIFLGLLLCSRWLLSFYGESFGAGFLPLVIIASGQALFSSIGTVWQLMLATERERELFWSTIMGTLLTISLGYALIPHYHLVGAAISIISSTLVISILGVWRLHRKTGILSIPL